MAADIVPLPNTSKNKNVFDMVIEDVEKAVFDYVANNES